MFPASRAAWVPVFIATPTSAWASAGGEGGLTSASATEQVDIDQKGAAGDDVLTFTAAAEAARRPRPGGGAGDGPDRGDGGGPGEDSTGGGNRSGAHLGPQDQSGAGIGLVSGGQRPNRSGCVLETGVFFGDHLAVYLQFIH